MANTDLERDSTRTERERQRLDMREGRNDNRMRIWTATETRRSFLTTEFWLSLAMAVALIIAGYADDDFSVDHGWALGAGVIAAYALSRGFAKAGSRDPQIKSVNLDD